MSIKEEGYLHDYIAAGLIGFVVGIAIAETVGIIPISVTYSWWGGITTGVDWGRVAAQKLVSGIFGYLPGGFIAGYLNFRLHKGEDGRMEGITAGIIAFLAHFFITLFTTLLGTAIYSGDLGIAMGTWGLSVAFAIFCYPLGGYIASLAEEKTMPLPPFLKLKFGPTTPAPPPPPGAAVCPTCGGPLTYVEQYQRWYCYKCKKYA